MAKKIEIKLPCIAHTRGTSTLPRPDTKTLIVLAETYTPFEIARAYGVMKIIAEEWLREEGFCPAPRCGGLWARRPPAVHEETSHRKPTLPALSMHQAFLADPRNIKRKRLMENLS
ncbi:hypothetical protein ACQZ57_24785 [Agrobacterium vitis]